MRGAPRLACLVVLIVVLAAIPFVANADTGPEPSEASPFEPGRPRITEASGEALFHFQGACLDNGSQCFGDHRATDGAFFLPSSAYDGLVTVSWRPEHDSLRVLRVTVAGLTLEGESPLRFVLPGTPAGEHRVAVAPAQRLVGSYDQRVDWTAVFELGVPLPYVDASGHAWYDVSARCAVVACHGLTRQSSDELVLPWSALGSLTATWPSNLGPHVVCLRGTDRCAEGDSPLPIRLDGLPAGSYRIDARPAGLGSEVSSGEIRWSAYLVKAR